MGRLVPPGRVLFQALGHDRSQVFRDVGSGLAQGLGVFLDDLDQDAGEVASAERRHARDQLVEHDAQAVDVGAPVERAPLGLLGGDVGRGAADHAGTGEAHLVLLHGETEVDHVGVEAAGLLACQQDVPRLQVAVDQPRPVGGVNGPRHVPQEPDLVLQRQLLGQLPQAAAVDELHGDVGAPLDLADLVDLADVRVVHPRLGPGLAQEALGLRSPVPVEELERHPAAERGVERLADGAHAARAEEVIDPVACPAFEKAQLRWKLGSPGRDLAGIGRPEGRAATRQIGGQVVHRPLKLLGELRHRAGLEETGLHEGAHPPPLFGRVFSLPVDRGQMVGDGVEVFPAEEAFRDRQPQEAALRGQDHGCSREHQSTPFGAGQARFVTAAPDPSSLSLPLPVLRPAITPRPGEGNLAETWEAVGCAVRTTPPLKVRRAHPTGNTGRGASPSPGEGGREGAGEGARG